MNKRNIDKQDKNIIIQYSKGNEKYKKEIKKNIT